MKNRREFLKKSAVGAAAGAAVSALSAPAIAQSTPEIRWRCASSFPKNLDTLFGGAELFSKRLAELTNGKFQVRIFAAGEIVPAYGVADAVQNNTVECGHTCGYYFVGKNKAFAFETTIPFGMNQRMQNAWMYWGGGLKLQREFLSDYNITTFPMGNTGTQMGGWFRKPVKTLADLKGLKMRIPGIGGEVMAKLGVVPQQLPGGEIYPALERGVIDAAEWVGPYDDEKLGLYRVAPNYYYPGWWESCAMLSMYVNMKEWEKLPKQYQEAFQTVCAECNQDMMAEYDYKNPIALQSLVKSGVKLHSFSTEIMKAAQMAAFDLYETESAKNPAFKKIYEPWRKFRNDQFLWNKVAEHTLMSFMLSNPAK
jgi:TRAP-type mannitol/chloroaromatic compound transport system substrate-binding protein